MSKEERTELDWEGIQRAIDDAGVEPVDIEEFAKSIRNAVDMEEIRKLLENLVEAFVEIGESFMRMFRQIYDEHGAPYGDSDEDMVRWFNDLSDLAQPGNGDE